MKKDKRVFLAEVVIKSKSKKLPDFGLGKGVLGSQEIVVSEEQYHSPMFAMGIVNHEKEMIEQLVEVRWTEVKKKAKK